MTARVFLLCLTLLVMITSARAYPYDPDKPARGNIFQSLSEGGRKSWGIWSGIFGVSGLLGISLRRIWDVLLVLGFILAGLTGVLAVDMYQRWLIRIDLRTHHPCYADMSYYVGLMKKNIASHEELVEIEENCIGGPRSRLPRIIKHLMNDLEWVRPQDEGDPITVYQVANDFEPRLRGMVVETLWRAINKHFVNRNPSVWNPEYVIRGREFSSDFLKSRRKKEKNL